MIWGLANQLMRLRTLLWGRKFPARINNPEEIPGQGESYKPNTRQSGADYHRHCFSRAGSGRTVVRIHAREFPEMQRTWEKKSKRSRARQIMRDTMQRLSARPASCRLTL